jgi:tape measure domain-containing protein
MFGKTKVQAEELRSQLGERIPGAVQIMARAAKRAGLIEGEGSDLVGNLEKLMENGKLYAKDVLPAFAEELREFAASGIDKALDSNRIAMNRLIFASQDARNEFFKAGFGEGLTDLFRTLATTTGELIPLFKGFGRILGSVFHIISRSVQLITPPLRFIGMLFDNLTEIMGKFSFIVTSGLMVAFSSLLVKIPALTAFFMALRKGALGFLLPLLQVIVALGAIEELLNRYVFKDKLGLGYDPRLDPESKHYDKNMAITQQKSAKSNTPLSESMLANGVTLPPSLITNPISWIKQMYSTLKPEGSFNLHANPIKIALDVKNSISKDGNITSFVDSRVNEQWGNTLTSAYSGLAGGN